MPETKALQAERDEMMAKIAEHETAWADLAEYRANQEKPTYEPNVWYDWHGGECPVDGYVRVAVRFADGDECYDCPARFWDMGPQSWWKWESNYPDHHINSFKILP